MKSVVVTSNQPNDDNSDGESEISNEEVALHIRFNTKKWLNAVAYLKKIA